MRACNPTLQKAQLADVRAGVPGLICKKAAQLDVVAVTEVTFRAGAGWSKDLKAYSGTPLCELPHEALVITGTLRVALRDGSHEDFSAGDVMLLPPGHDAWAVGDWACTFAGFSKGDGYYSEGSAFLDDRAWRPVPAPPVKGGPAVADESRHHDPTFYRSPRDAAAGPPEKLAYVATFSKPAGQPDAIAVVDTDPASAGYASVVGFSELPHTGDELHHFGWNACSSALCPTGDHRHGDRRYLVVPGIRSSRISILDTQPDPAAPQVVKVLGPEELARRANYSRPHTVHCGPGYLYVSCLGGGNGNDGPGGVALLDHSSFEVIGQFETAGRGGQYLAYDVWWHINHNVLVTSEWGTPSMIEDGIVPELLLGRKYGHRLHFWDMETRRHVQAVDLGDQHQMALELRPAHDPANKYGFVGVVISVEDLSASIWLWHDRDGTWAADKVISIPAEPAPAEQLPPLLQGFGAVPPLVTDIGLSVDDRFLYVSCWGTGEMKQYDVTDPFHPRETGSVRIGGIAGRAPHPARPGQPLAGGPQMVEVSRDGKRVYFTNSLYGALDEQFYPDGVGAWMTKLDVADGGGIGFDQRFFLEGDAFRGRRAHQVRLEGGDASSDSYCYS